MAFTINAGSDGIGKLVSILVSVADPLTPHSPLLRQLGMEPMVGVDPLIPVQPAFAMVRCFFPSTGSKHPVKT